MCLLHSLPTIVTFCFVPYTKHSFAFVPFTLGTNKCNTRQRLHVVKTIAPNTHHNSWALTNAVTRAFFCSLHYNVNCAVVFEQSAFDESLPRPLPFFVITKLFIVHRGVCASYMLLNCSAKKDFDVAHDCDTTLPTVGVDIVCVTSICDEVAAQHCCIIPFRMIPEKIILWASTTHTDKQMCNMHVVMIICKRHYKTRNMCSVQMRCGPRLLSLSKKVKSNFLSIAIAQIQFTVVKNGFWLRRRNGQYLSPFKRPSSPWIF